MNAAIEGTRWFASFASIASIKPENAGGKSPLTARIDGSGAAAERW
jgi:hypothetical protein